jgi:hypothetical protein
MKTFDLSKCDKNERGQWLAQTEQGYAVELAYIDLQGPYPLLGVTIDRAGQRYGCRWTRAGVPMTTDGEPYNLVNIPRRMCFERIVNVLKPPVGPPTLGQFCLSRNQADNLAVGQTRLAVVKVVIECEEGEGL